MNWKKGIERFTLVLSILAGPIVFCIFCIAWGGPNDFDEGAKFFVVFEILGFVVVWAIYFTVLWIIKGFRDDEKK